MGHRRECVLATTGTSILTNLEELQAARDWATWLERQPAGERAALTDDRVHIENACRHAARGAWEDSGATLAELRGQPRLLGAEVGSFVALRAESAYAAVREIVLLYSDTSQGEAAALILRALMSRRFGIVAEVRRIPSLQDANPSQFKVAGLRNLVRELASQVARRGSDAVVIDATGGYKAQVAMAVLFGQAYGIPVVYRFERFAEIIEFPPMPFSFDLGTVETIHDLLELEVISPEALERRLGRPLTEANQTFAAVQAMLRGVVDSNGQDAFAPSPFGQLALEVWRHRQAVRP
ncbi:MAG TPA: putative CRISPR-associated protein [Thermoanaerobaculaceae bacterium]|nr:putative CRISPR-associated protein [Thermoanaerobaculaceae bacterium]HRS15466.1 putative CRISPR-associated protein [Thermoanaerobaculaceae bacterium]